MPLVSTRVLSVLFGLVLAISAVACSYDSDLTDVTCDEDGATEEGRTCVNGFWVEGYEEPPNNDDPNNDDPNQSCDPDDDDQLCSDNDLECGNQSVSVDGCEDPIAVECGECDEGFCFEDTALCSPCPESGADQVCADNLPDDECGTIDLPEGCEGDNGTFTCGCEAECDDWDENTCEIEDGSCGGSQTRHCNARECDDGTCVFQSDEDFQESGGPECFAPEDDPCQPDEENCNADDDSCDGDLNCQRGRCTGDDDSCPTAQLRCEDGDDACGNNTDARSCSDLDAAYPTGNYQDCCGGDELCLCPEMEQRTYSCNGETCTYDTGSPFIDEDSPVECSACDEPPECETTSCTAESSDICPVMGTQDETCTPYLCDDSDASAATCLPEPNELIITEDVECTLDPPVETCAPPGDTSCPADSGDCSAPGECLPPCSGEDDQCGCDSDNCINCTTLDPDKEEASAPIAQCTGGVPQILQNFTITPHICSGDECVPGDDSTVEEQEVTADLLNDNVELIECDGGGNPSCNNNADDTSDITIPDEYESIACCDYSGDSNSSQCYVCFDDGTCELLED